MIDLTVESISSIISDYIVDNNLQNLKTVKLSLYKYMRIYNDVYIRIINYHYDKNIGKSLNIEHLTSSLDTLGSICHLNTKYKEVELHDVSFIEFEKLYSNILLRLYKDGKIESNHPEFFTILEFLLSNIDRFKKDNDDISGVANILVNMTYLISQYRYVNLIIKTKNDNETTCNLLTKYSRDIFEDLINNSNAIYIDTDLIYYKESDQITDYIKTLNLPFNKYTCSCYFKERQQYISISKHKIRNNIKNSSTIFNGMMRYLKIREIMLRKQKRNGN